jgi:hypothetical protein
MIRKTRKNSETVFKIGGRNKTSAEVRLTKPKVAPGEAVRELIQLRRELSSLKGNSKESISRRVKHYLYGRGNR